MTTRLLLVDDHELMREGLRAILEREPDIEILGEADNGRTAVELARTLSPDVVVMDVAMKDMNGIEATRQIRADCPGVKVIALSSHSDSRYVSAILDAGANGYVLKADAYHDLRRAIKAALADQIYLSPEVSERRLFTPSKTNCPETSFGSLLSPREREILQLLAEGLSSPNIGRRLVLATTTVETHRRNISRKLNLHSVAELTKYAIREGITSV